MAGACASADRQLFLGYPGEPVVARLAREEDAKRVCARCSVLLECRASALAESAPVGVRGGLTANERGAVRRRRAHH
ncbi:WhiB family transcriptional regulator [Embleya sp. NPDC005575]|uniref:WhiB family transcriptional regulator n=1 Tax=Embleya sp. NPDC005575 TaxID=3156892 RepID=UPI0033B2760B